MKTIKIFTYALVLILGLSNCAKDELLTSPIGQQGPPGDPPGSEFPLTGHVKDHQSNPIINGIVKLFYTGTTTLYDQKTTDSNGDFDFGDVNEGTYDMDVIKNGYYTYETTFTLDQNKHFVITLTEQP